MDLPKSHRRRWILRLLLATLEGICCNQISIESETYLLATQISQYECRDKEFQSKKNKKKSSDDENEEKMEESGGEDAQLDNIE